MEHISLAGNWLLSREGGAEIPGRLPGCTYLDYLSQGMADPFFGVNETEANELARHDYCYRRAFDADEATLSRAHVELVADGLDTLCSVYVNGRLAGEANNINRVWRFDVKPLCRCGTNELELRFRNPYAFIEKAQAADPLTGSSPIPGVGHLRKTVCHFGWDWGPALPPAGVTRGIELQAYDLRLEDVRITQRHESGRVTLQVHADLFGGACDAAARLSLIDPDGACAEYPAQCEGDALDWTIPVDNPKLWWCNGLGEQPLYRLEITLLHGDEIADSARKRIGLRTVKLDTAPDEHGRQFRFLINDVPIFAKGADWIPADSFITRADSETMRFYAQAAKRANMNMLRVWGGGTYEAEAFYDACDECGILVWQDFCFACNPYPLYDEAFVENVRAEVIDNVRRLRHRASLALWCGNNENEVFMRFWKDKRVQQSNRDFYHRVLRGWTDELDGVTPYWPGSPSSGAPDLPFHSLKEGKICGDTHLWQIWHGMRPIEAFRKFPTRFCSEFGMESMPSMRTVATYTDSPSPELFDPIMLHHQKSGGGNAKMLYYLLAKYRNPARFEDFVYLSQLVQADTIRFATDCWRRRIGQSNGALYWQLNDCWPVASWAGIDYGKQEKAVMYHARHFNKMLCLSNDYYRDRVELYVVNEYPQAFAGRMEWTLTDLSGSPISSGSEAVAVDAVGSSRAAVLRFREVLRGASKANAVLEVALLDENGERDRKRWLLVPDRKAKLSAPDITADCAVADGTATVTLRAKSYARYVYVDAPQATAPWSDNFVDIPAGASATLTVPVRDGTTAEALSASLTIKSLADVQPKNGRLKDRWLRAAMMGKDKNYRTWFVFKFLLG